MSMMAKSDGNPQGAPQLSRTAGAKKDRVFASKDQRAEFVGSSSQSKEFVGSSSPSKDRQAEFVRSSSHSKEFSRSPPADTSLASRSPRQDQRFPAEDKKGKAQEPRGGSAESTKENKAASEEPPTLERASTAHSTGQLSTAQPEEEANPEAEQSSPTLPDRKPILVKSGITSNERVQDASPKFVKSGTTSSERVDRQTTELKLKSKVSFKNPRVNSLSFMGKVSEHPYFEAAALVTILCNAVWIGVDTDFNDPDDPQISFFFRMVENIFCALFTFELLVRFLAYHKWLDFFRDPLMVKWNLFDGILVFIMIVETWVMPFFAVGGSFSQLSTLRLLRLLRISRIFRMVPELGMMVKSMLAAVRSVSSTFLLAVGIMYVFAIILTQWSKGIQVPEAEPEVVPDSSSSDGFSVSNMSGMLLNASGLTKCEPIGEEEEEPSTEEQLIEAWGTIPRSLLSLMQILVFDDTFSLIRTTMLLNFSLGFLLIFFILVASFTVLNMLIGVICEIVSSTTADEKEKLLRAKVDDIFQQIDIDGSGTISRSEFESLNAVALMAKLGIEQVLLDNAFEILDTDEDDNLESAEFIDMIFKLLNPPLSQDVLIIHRKIDKLREALKRHLRWESVIAKGERRMNEIECQKWDALDSVCDLEERLITITQSIPNEGLQVREAPEEVSTKDDVEKARMDMELESFNQALLQLENYLSGPIVENLRGVYAEMQGGDEWMLQLVNEALAGIASATNAINSVCVEGSAEASSRDQMLRQVAGSRFDKPGSV